MRAGEFPVVNIDVDQLRAALASSSTEAAFEQGVCHSANLPTPAELTAFSTKISHMFNLTSCGTGTWSVCYLHTSQVPTLAESDSLAVVRRPYC